MTHTICAKREYPLATQHTNAQSARSINNNQSKRIELRSSSRQGRLTSKQMLFTHPASGTRPLQCSSLHTSYRGVSASQQRTSKKRPNPLTCSLSPVVCLARPSRLNSALTYCSHARGRSPPCAWSNGRQRGRSEHLRAFVAIIRHRTRVRRGLHRCDVKAQDSLLVSHTVESRMFIGVPLDL